MRTWLVCIIALGLCACGDDPPASAPAATPAAKPQAEAPNALPPNGNDATVATAGRAVYAHYCADCHDGGPGHPGTMRLALRFDTSVLRERTDLAPDYVKFVVRNGYQMMPPFRPTEIADAELDDLAAYVAAATIAPGK